MTALVVADVLQKFKSQNSLVYDRFYRVSFIFINDRVINGVYSEFASCVPGLEAVLMIS